MHIIQCSPSESQEYWVMLPCFLLFSSNYFSLWGFSDKYCTEELRINILYSLLFYFCTIFRYCTILYINIFYSKGWLRGVQFFVKSWFLLQIISLLNLTERCYLEHDEKIPPNHLVLAPNVFFNARLTAQLLTQLVTEIVFWKKHSLKIPCDPQSRKTILMYSQMLIDRN